MDISKLNSKPLSSKIDTKILISNKMTKVLPRKTSDLCAKSVEAGGKLVTMIRKIKQETPEPKIVEFESAINYLTPITTIKTEPVDPQLKFIEDTTSITNSAIDNSSEGDEPIEQDSESVPLETEPMCVDEEVIVDGNVNAEFEYMQQQQRLEYNSSSSDEEDNHLAEQILQLEQRFQEKEAQARLVTQTKLEALEAGMKFLGAIFNFTGLGSLRIPVKKPEPAKEPLVNMGASISSNVKHERKEKRVEHSQTRNDKKATKSEEEFDLGIFNPAELTRKMQQFISQEDGPQATKRKYQRTAYKTKLYKHHRRWEHPFQSSQSSTMKPNWQSVRHMQQNRLANLNRIMMRSRMNAVRRPRGRPRKLPVVNVQIPNGISVPLTVKKEKKIEMTSASIDLPIIKAISETDEERNRRLLELSNATGSQSIKHQMMRNSCIDDLFQSSLFQSSDL